MNISMQIPTLDGHINKMLVETVTQTHYLNTPANYGSRVMSDLERYGLQPHYSNNGDYKGECVAPDDDGEFIKYDEAADLVEQQQARISELEQREAELAATVERLRGAFSQDIVYLVVFAIEKKYKGKYLEMANEKYYQPLIDAIDATPHQNLNAVKREVAQEAFIEGCQFGSDYYSFEWECESKHYANKHYPDKE